MLTVKQAAERLGIEPRSVRSLIEVGHLKAEPIAGIWLIYEVDLVEHEEMRSEPRTGKGRPFRQPPRA